MASLPSALVQEGRLLEPATGDRFGIQLQPLLENRRVNAAEVRARVQVALNQLLGLEGGIFAEVTPFDLVTEDESGPRRTVVGPRAVVVDAAAELREQQDDDVVGVVVLTQVSHEGLETLAHGAPQLSVARVLTRVGVEAPVITVEDPAAQIGEVHLGDPAQLAGDRSIG